MSAGRRPRVGLVLGSGSARGWAHIGVIRGLEQAGIRPDIVCGTSIGALVGAAYAAGELDRLESWALGMRFRDVVGYLDISLSSGLIKGERLMDFFRRHVEDRPIEKLAMPFGAVATVLETGAEVWLREGSTMDAVRASIALPGLISPVLSSEGMLLVDGGLVNPVPVSLARAMGADVLIAVDLGADMRVHARGVNHEAEAATPEVTNWMRKLKENLGTLIPALSKDEPAMPSMIEVLASSINVMQVRITRSRMAGEPPDLIVTPHLSHLELLDFDQAKAAIEEGRRAVERVAHIISTLHIF